MGIPNVMVAKMVYFRFFFEFEMIILKLPFMPIVSF